MGVRYVNSLVYASDTIFLYCIIFSYANVYLNLSYASGCSRGTVDNIYCVYFLFNKVLTITYFNACHT